MAYTFEEAFSKIGSAEYSGVNADLIKFSIREIS